MALPPDPVRFRSSDEQWAWEAAQAERDPRWKGQMEPMTMFGTIAGLFVLRSAVGGVGKAQEAETLAGSAQPPKEP